MSRSEREREEQFLRERAVADERFGRALREAAHLSGGHAVRQVVIDQAEKRRRKDYQHASDNYRRP